MYIGETGRRLGDRFRKHLQGVERNDKDASKPVARHFNLSNHSSQHMTICGLSLHGKPLKSRTKLQFSNQVKINEDKIERRFGVVMTPFSSSK